MNAALRRFCTFVIVLNLSLLTPIAFSQNDRSQAEARAWVSETLRYYRLADKATPQDGEKILELRAKFLAPQLDFQNRLSACTEAYSVFLRLLGNSSAPQPTIIQGCLLPTKITHSLVTNAEYQTFNLSTSSLGELGHVEKMGRGPVPLILIPDYGTDWTLYHTFMERNRDRYTMYAVTLSGFGGTPAPPKPAFYNPAATPWWNGAEQGVVKLIDKHKLNRPLVVGTQAGAYLATRLALNHPTKIRGVVLLNGLVSMPVLAPENPIAPLNWQERQRLIAKRPDLIGLMAELMPQVMLTPSAARQTLRQMPPPLLGS